MLIKHLLQGYRSFPEIVQTLASVIHHRLFFGNGNLQFLEIFLCSGNGIPEFSGTGLFFPNLLFQAFPGFLLADVQLGQTILSGFHGSLKRGQGRICLVQFFRCLTVTPVRLLHCLPRDRFPG